MTLSNTFLKTTLLFGLTLFPVAGHSQIFSLLSDSEKTEENYSNVEVPTSITFCNRPVDLTRFDRRERMDRELMAFTYMHSTSLQIIKRANRYFPVVEPILKENGIPDDFKYLMVIESNLNPQARSGAGAAGLWQFMPTTGREYGLEVNRNIDERYHIEKATRAACQYLKDSFEKYKDWIAVAASYNAGQARIARLMEKQYTEETLDLYMVEETARYVYRIMAAKIMMNNPTAFGFRLKASHLYPPIPYREVTVKEGITDLARWARGRGISYAMLKRMNPWLRDTFLQNRSHRTYVLKVPLQDGMYIKPQQIVPYNKKWIVD